MFLVVFNWVHAAEKNLLHCSQSSHRVPPLLRSPLAAPTVHRQRSAVQRPLPSCSPSPAPGLLERSRRCRTSWKFPWWKQKSTQAPNPWWWTPPATATHWGRRWRSRLCRGSWTLGSSSAAPGCQSITHTQRADSLAAFRAWRLKAARTTWTWSRWDQSSASWSESSHPSELIRPLVTHAGHPSVRHPARL